MKILLVHSFYGSSAPSGENSVFEQEMKLLSDAGHTVHCFTKSSDIDIPKGIIGLVKVGLTTPWNNKVREEFERVLKHFKPDIIHVHNTFPNISPSIFWANRKMIPIVITLHNYRLLCPAAIPMLNGKICLQCMESNNTVYSVKNGCYRNSKLATIPLAFSVALHKKICTWINKVDGFIALTDFQKDLMGKYGLPIEKIYVKPNFFSGKPCVINWNERKNVVVFAGRISKEKGVNTLINAWLRWGQDAPELHIFGDGPEKLILKEKTQLLKNVIWHGQCPGSTVFEAISYSKLIVLPSLWFEGFPMVLREAFTFGTPSIVSDIGPLPSLVMPNAGLAFKAGDDNDLLTTIKSIWSNDMVLQEMSRSARKLYEDKYTEDANILQLMDIYHTVIKKKCIE